MEGLSGSKMIPPNNSAPLLLPTAFEGTICPLLSFVLSQEVPFQQHGNDDLQ